MAAEAPFYDDVVLPDEFAPGLEVTLNWEVFIKKRARRQTGPGKELRMLRASQPGLTVDVSYEAGRADLIELLQNLHFVTAGPYAGFPALDPNDFTVPFPGGSPQLLGTGGAISLVGTGDDGVTIFQLVKTYTVGSRTRDRIITRPMSTTY